ncbi:hypothetical protein Tco_0098223 [Tanacetum coccineum]
MILQSVENGPLIWPTVEENGVTRIKKYAELSAVRANSADYDRKATNLFFKGCQTCKRFSYVPTLINFMHILNNTNSMQMKVRLLRERNQDPLAFAANQQMTPPHFNTYQSSYNNPQIQQQFPPS